MEKVKLISVFNHRYDKNIEILKKYYMPAFSQINFLVPFYDGNEPQVIPVRRNVSYNFSGFFHEAFAYYYDPQIDYYLFLADDAILNPKYNEENILKKLVPNGEIAYISGIYPVNRSYGIEWAHAAYSNISVSYMGKNFYKFIPTYNYMLEKMKKFFPNYSDRIASDFMDYKTPVEQWISRRRASVFSATKRDDGRCIYPLAMGWSDIVMVHKSIIKQFVRLCGLFAAIHMFCEIAVPTSLVCCCVPNQVSTLSKLMIQQNMSQQVLWGSNRIEIVRKYCSDFEKLINDFPEKGILIHPIKLSQWKTDTIKELKNEAKDST